MHVSRRPFVISIGCLIASAALIVFTLAGDLEPVSMAFYGYTLSPYLIAAWFVLMHWGEKDFIDRRQSIEQR
jgi:hypothetical protein